MKKNKKAMSLIIVMGILLITGLLLLTLLELLIPFSKSVSGIENSSRAYYLANSGIEESLYKLKKENINNTNFSLKEDFSPLSDIKSESRGVYVDLKNKGRKEPENGKGNSEFDKDYNKISVGEPIQMDISGTNIGSLRIYFKVPEIEGKKYKLKDKDKLYINWQFSGEGDFLNGVSKEYYEKHYGITNTRSISNIITFLDGEKIDEFTSNRGKINIGLLRGLNKDNSSENISNMYNKLNCNNNNNNNNKCILKFSIVNELKTENEITLPYLEWRIEVTSSSRSNFKFRYADIKSEGKSFGYTRELEIKVPQTTLNEAFDFAVFQ